MFRRNNRHLFVKNQISDCRSFSVSFLLVSSNRKYKFIVNAMNKGSFDAICCSKNYKLMKRYSVIDMRIQGRRLIEKCRILLKYNVRLSV